MNAFKRLQSMIDIEINEVGMCLIIGEYDIYHQNSNYPKIQGVPNTITHVDEDLNLSGYILLYKEFRTS